MAVLIEVIVDRGVDSGEAISKLNANQIALEGAFAVLARTQMARS